MLRLRDTAMPRTPLLLLVCALLGVGCDSRPSSPGSPAARVPAAPIQAGGNYVRPTEDAGRGGKSGCDETPIAPSATPVRIVVIGDYGSAGPPEAQAAALVKKLDPDFIITTGDNNYPLGEAVTIDQNIGQFYREFICPYRGKRGAGATRNRFFPTLGNHDWYTPGAAPYLDYFTLPGIERYYEMRWGNVHLFALDSDVNEPHGITATSTQAAWLKTHLADSDAPWKLVAMHHPPFSSGPHQATPALQWPYAEWGASLVLAGHDHTYERFSIGGLPYVVTGLGGASIYQFSTIAEGSLVRYNAGLGVLLLEAEPTRLVGRFITVGGETVDEFVLNHP